MIVGDQPLALARIEIRRAQRVEEAHAAAGRRRARRGR